MASGSSTSPSPLFGHMRFLDSSFERNRQKRRIFGRALGVRDILHSTRSLYRRDNIDELVSTTQPTTQPQARSVVWSPHLQQDGAATKPVQKRDGYDLASGSGSFRPDTSSLLDEKDEHEHSHAIHRTRPLTPEHSSQYRSESERPVADVSSQFPRPPSSLKRTKTSFSIPTSMTVSDPCDQPLHTQSGSPIPPRKDSRTGVILNLVDQRTTKGNDFRDSIQSVTAYVTADYSSERATTPTLTLTSWLSDPDGPPDDLASWNTPATKPPQQPRHGSVSASTRPQLGPRSKTTPIYSTAVPPQEMPDAAYERILREKLRHHAGQVKKRLDTSTYYSPTVRQNEIEVHLAFVRAAEEILKQSPVWHGSANVTGIANTETKLKYLLET